MTGNERSHKPTWLLHHWEFVDVVYLDFGTCINSSQWTVLPRIMRDSSKKNNIFAQFRKNDRDKQKLIETVVKQLRSLVNGMSQHT
ncbi:exocyst complex component 6 isoform x2 [Limosa lapponica baueri]|uniref:Exocyst complex component 6 isoform x2 n=1 Tax=Limosa lapponica baueri TaxID=1758121 RepID=A0A2I0U7U4_LIMLA|nr:exocyst complex component 6 isoform x2 [Limosa lapponica baueri]